MLLQCSDSVSWGKWGSTDMELITRFHGEYGARYTVECPTRCLSALPLIYGLGKGPYLDETSICKAAGNHESFVLFIMKKVTHRGKGGGGGRREEIAAVSDADAAASDAKAACNAGACKGRRM